MSLATSITGQADSRAVILACRFCGSPLQQTLVDLGKSPLCETYLTLDQLGQPETFYPLHVRICHECLLAQLPEFVGGDEIFGGEYAYFSSYSDSWLQHAKRYVEQITERLGLDKTSQVIEVASNDGYLLQFFVRRGIPTLGIEPAANVAAAATERGVPTEVQFFGFDCARQLRARGTAADLLVANNVLAHVPALNDFIAGLHEVLAPSGVLTAEFPHLLRLVEGNQFDTIYHEHYCYFSLHALKAIFEAHGLVVFEVQTLATHGGSLRVMAARRESPREVSDSVGHVLAEERVAGMTGVDFARDFTARVQRARHALLDFLIDARRRGKQVVGYGAPGKGNTLLNYCGVRDDLLSYTVDRNPYKHGKFLPGTHIPVYPVSRIDQTRPDYVLVLPWNLAHEITVQMQHVRQWGGRFVVPIPEVQVLP